MLVAILGWIAAQLATAACFDSVGAAYLGKEKTWQESVSVARRQFRSLIWLQFLLAVVLVVAFVALIVPGIHLYAALALATPVLLFEGRKGKAALGRSRALIRGRWWPTAAVLLVVQILTFLVGGALGGVLASARTSRLMNAPCSGAICMTAMSPSSSVSAARRRSTSSWRAPCSAM
jgi:hypothetical protein